MSSIPWVVEEVEPVVAGSTITYSISWQGASTLASPGATVYMNGTDITSTVMPSGSHSSSGNVQTLKPLAFQATHGDNYYVVAASCTVDGNSEIVKFKVKVVRPSEE